jgi:hypothetical protein
MIPAAELATFWGSLIGEVHIYMYRRGELVAEAHGLVIEPACPLVGGGGSDNTSASK